MRVETGTKLVMTRMRIDDSDEGTVDPNQLWVRVRTTVVDLSLGTAHGWERCVEATRSGGGAVALGGRMKTMEAEKKTR